MPKPTNSGLPKTKVYYENIVLSDLNPTTNKWETYWFPRRMVAYPLTLEGPAGYGPSNSLTECPDWWALFQARHKTTADVWVRGHLLNDNVHGPGGRENLVPIAKQLNTNMLNAVEVQVKARVAKGEVLRYTVEAHWEGCHPKAYELLVQSLSAFQADPANASDDVKRAAGTMIGAAGAVLALHKTAPGDVATYMQGKHPNQKTPKVTWVPPAWTREMLHPMAMRQSFDQLVWGEQFAPTRLSWTLESVANWATGHPTFTPLSTWRTYGTENDWYNSWPV